MKPTLLKLIPAIMAAGALGWTAVSLSANPAVAEKADPKIDQSEAIAQMDRDQENISTRLKMSAPIELYLVNGKDPVMEGVKNGMIIDVSLEKVEADLAAAAATPDIQDDMRASEQAHRASFRFFPSSSVQGGRSK